MQRLKVKRQKGANCNKKLLKYWAWSPWLMFAISFFRRGGATLLWGADIPRFRGIGGQINCSRFFPCFQMP